MSWIVRFHGLHVEEEYTETWQFKTRDEAVKFANLLEKTKHRIVECFEPRYATLVDQRELEEELRGIEEENK